MVNMELHYLKLFHAVASFLSLSRAAEELHISQPAVSIQIKKLEEEIGLKLFERKGRQVYLTQSGIILYRYTTKIFDLVGQATAELYSLKGTIWGKVQVGASNTPGIYIMPRILGKYKKKYPDVVTNLHVKTTYEIENMLYQNQLDFAIMGGGVSREDIFNLEKLMVDEVVLAVSPENPLAQRGIVTAEELIKEQYITHEHNSALFRLVENIVEELGLPFTVAMSLGSIDAIKQAISYNLGISFVPRISIELELELGLIKEIKIKNKEWKYPYYLVHHKGKQFAPAVEKLIELCKKELKEMGGKNN